MRYSKRRLKRIKMRKMMNRNKIMIRRMRSLKSQLKRKRKKTRNQIMRKKMKNLNRLLKRERKKKSNLLQISLKNKMKSILGQTMKMSKVNKFKKKWTASLIKSRKKQMIKQKKKRKTKFQKLKTNTSLKRLHQPQVSKLILKLKGSKLVKNHLKLKHPQPLLPRMTQSNQREEEVFQVLLASLDLRINMLKTIIIMLVGKISPLLY